jgi:putative ABC transport system permease protein
MQQGVGNMHMATSYVSDSKAEEVARVPGVARVDGILYLNTVVQAGPARWFSYVVGIDGPDTRAGPWAMAAGRPLPRRGEAVVPAAFTRMGVGLGDSIRITDLELRVVGSTHGTFSMANSVIFVNRIDLEDLMRSLDILSFLLVQADEGVDPGSLAADIERHVAKVSALTRDEFVANDRRMAMQMGVETIALMSVIGGALAMLIVAFTCYSLVARQRRELAVASAIGATPWSLYGSVAVQGAAITLVSISVGVALAALAVPVVTWLVPQVSLHISAGSVGRVAVVGVVAGVLASLWPARQVARVDPASVFQS